MKGFVAAFRGGGGGGGDRAELLPGGGAAGDVYGSHLHDVGKLVMGRFISPEISELRRAQEVERLGQLEAESLLLSVNHAELGGLIAQRPESGTAA